MALAANERWTLGFVRDVDTGELAGTTDTTDAAWWNGFLRDPDGRVVLTTSLTGARWQCGFLRDTLGRLVTVSG